MLIALAPCLFLFWYFIHRDRYEPEPKRYIIKIYFLGALMVLPGLIIEGLLGPIFISMSPVLNAFLLAFILVAPTEEILNSWW
uniref:PrsW family intramembrane metalloprotease n=1 Tax=candidate division WOR-3 bacterium TaxID=2052148 RepID=A0A7V1EHJ7_UNCW3